MERPPIHLDNAATSHPKPPGVAEAVARHLTEIGASPGRGGYVGTVQSQAVVDRLRSRLRRLCNAPGSDERMLFTLNGTDALNLAIRGLAMPKLLRGEPVRVVATDLEHNSVIRPFRTLETLGAEVVFVPLDPHTGVANPNQFAEALSPETILCAAIHGSNVTGAVQPLAEFGAAAKANHVPFLVDASQTLGRIPVDVEAMQIDMLAFSGHKYLLGPLGTGGLWVRDHLNLMPLRDGGTGSMSELESQPECWPDRFEPGSHNTTGLFGLDAALEWIETQSIETLATRERDLHLKMAECIEATPGLHRLGPKAPTLGTFALQHDEYDSATFAAILDSQFHLHLRAGLHCAPRIHRQLNSDTTGGAVRLSLGATTPLDAVDRLAEALQTISKQELGV